MSDSKEFYLVVVVDSGVLLEVDAYKKSQDAVSQFDYYNDQYGEDPDIDIHLFELTIN